MGRKWRSTFRFFYCQLAVLKARRVEPGSDVGRLVDFAFRDCWELIKPVQVEEEIAQLLAHVRGLQPRCVLEIGTGRSGGTLFLFSRIAAPDATLISVDLPGGKFGGGYPKRKVPFFKALCWPGQRVHLVRKNSHDPESLEIIKQILNGRSVDLLFIDGDHTYEGVKQDFEMYSPLVSENGVIALQDIVRHGPEMGCGVDRLWNELKPSYEHIEFVKDWNQERAGIGVFKGAGALSRTGAPA